MIRFSLPRAAALLLAAGVSACAPANNVTPLIDAKPAVSIPLGAQRDDVLALLGPPAKGPRVDTYSELVEYTYIYPFPAVSAESKLAKGQVRTEAADRLHLFFDRGGVLRRMGTRVNPYYPSFVTAPADKVTISARAIDIDGRQIPMVPGMVAPAAPAETPPSSGG